MIIIRKVELDDINNIFDLDSKTFNSESYKKEDFINYISDNNAFFICIYDDNDFLGYSLLKLFKPECELLKICIKKEKRNKKYGYELFLYILNHLKNNGYNKIFLEVRSDNDTAIRFYENNGFIIYNKRINYYKNPNSDALLYYKNIL